MASVFQAFQSFTSSLSSGNNEKAAEGGVVYSTTSIPKSNSAVNPNPNSSDVNSSSLSKIPNRPSQFQRHQLPNLGNSANAGSSNVSNMIADEDKMPNVLLQAYVRESLLRHARCAFRSLVEWQSVIVAPRVAAAAANQDVGDDNDDTTTAATVTPIYPAGMLDENSPPVSHMLFTLEILFVHGLSEKKGWFEDKKGLWGVFENLPNLVPKSQMETAKEFNSSIDNMEKVSNHVHKARAWLRKALMEKVLSDYLRLIYVNEEYLTQYYESYAIFRSEEFGGFLGTLQGLNALNFHFIFKDANFDLTLSDITYYLNIVRNSFPDESMVLHFDATKPVSLKISPKNASQSTPPSQPEATIPPNQEDLKESLAKALEQVSYMEEVNKHLKASLETEERKREKDQVSTAAHQKVWEAEREELQNIVVELQEKMALLEEENVKLKHLSQQQTQQINSLEKERGELEKIILELQEMPKANNELAKTKYSNSGFVSIEVVSGGHSGKKEEGEEEEGQQERQQEQDPEQQEHQEMPQEDDQNQNESQQENPKFEEYKDSQEGN